VARVVADRSTQSALVEGDEFSRFLRRGRIEPWLAESHTQNELVNRIQASTAGAYCLGGFETVFDGVLGPWFLGEFAEHAACSFDDVVLLPSVDTCRDHIRNRSGHGFDDESATRSLHDQFTTACDAAGIDRAHIVDSGAGTPDSIADEIDARRHAGVLHVS
jgi:hypothetical protein